MFLLIVYVLIALVFSFLCSVAEAVILSVNSAYIALLEQQGRQSGALLRKLKETINKPLAAILTLNTIAHTVGAAGAGAQAASLFGSAYLGIASAILTLMILVLSEIIPKTLGASYWRQLAPATAYTLRFLIIGLYPFVKLSEIITATISHKPPRRGFNRSEFSVMADLSQQEGHLGEQEATMMKNLMLLHDTQVRDIMTPRTVVYALDEETTIGEFVELPQRPFSRIPIYHDEPEKITGFVLRTDLLLAQARGLSDVRLKEYRRDMLAILDTVTCLKAFSELITEKYQLGLVVDEYGSLKGIFTLEDLVETLLGLEIVDEIDDTVDMRALARNLWKKRAAEVGIDYREFSP